MFRFAPVLFACALFVISSNAALAQNADEKCKALVDEYLKSYKPLFIESAQAWWEANTSGSKEAFARKEAAENKLEDVGGN
jgi:hypothetical protein